MKIMVGEGLRPGTIIFDSYIMAYQHGEMSGAEVTKTVYFTLQEIARKWKIEPQFLTIVEVHLYPMYGHVSDDAEVIVGVTAKYEPPQSDPISGKVDKIRF